jgi:hypothetical protein
MPVPTRYTDSKRAPATRGLVLKVLRRSQLVGDKQTRFEYVIADNKICNYISPVGYAIGKSSKTVLVSISSLKVIIPHP